MSDDMQEVDLHAHGSRFSLPTEAAEKRFRGSYLAQLQSAEKAEQELEAARNRTACLDFTLMLFDARLSLKLRGRIAGDLAVLLKNPGCGEYALDIILAVPLPDSADLQGATLAASQLPNVADHIATLIDCQERSAVAYHAWLELSAHPIVKDDTEHSRIRGVFIWLGVFRRFSVDARTQVDARKVAGEFAMVLKGKCDPRVLSEFVECFKKSLPPGTGISLAKESPQRRIDSNGPNDADQGTTRIDLSQAIPQVEKISDLYVKRQDGPADKILDQLLASQSHKDDQLHAVKSLCNIASKCWTAGRLDVEEKLLARVSQLPVDCTACEFIARMLVTNQRFEAAIEYYQKGIGLATSEEQADRVRRDVIQIAERQGEYQIALNAYKELLLRTQQRAETLTRIGSLYRRLGDLQWARKSYQDAISDDPGYVEAKIGVARTDLQSGRHWRAIRRLQDIKTESDAQEKHLQLLLGRLYRVVGRTKSAIQVAESLYGKYPLEPNVNLQLAALYQIQENRLRSERHLKLAQDSEEHYGYTGQFDHLFGSFEEVPKGSLRPEHRAEYVCRKAVNSIAQGNPGIVGHAIRTARFIDYFQRDVAASIELHAAKLANAESLAFQDQHIRRIAKRGYRENRQLISAIICGEYKQAFTLEQKLILRSSSI